MKKKEKRVSILFVGMQSTNFHFNPNRKTFLKQFEKFKQNYLGFKIDSFDISKTSISQKIEENFCKEKHI